MSSIAQVSLELDIFPDSASQWDYLIEIIIEIYNWDYRYAPPQARLQYILMELDWWELAFGNEDTLFHVELTTRVVMVDSLCPIPPTRPTMACLTRDLLRNRTVSQSGLSEVSLLLSTRRLSFFLWPSLCLWGCSALLLQSEKEEPRMLWDPWAPELTRVGLFTLLDNIIV